MNTEAGKEVVKSEYETIIGLEVHIELSTKTKIFCGCSTVFGGAPNSNTCPVCAGMPGALPVLNREVVRKAIALGLSCHCSIAPELRFDRKNYFYPDNPQNYQITQLYAPICRGGYLEILPKANETGQAGQNVCRESGNTEQKKKRIRIYEMHIEEDAGKLIHEGNYSYVNYNRAGVPLIEIVTEPDLRNAEEVIAFLEIMKSRVQYLGVSDGKLQEGSLRADVNLSVRKKGSRTYGTRTEMKNLASFRAIRKAIEKESQRQIEILESGGKVEQETRRFDEKQETSFSMRSKEDVKDYRYFPEPDLPPITIAQDWIEEIRKNQPELREEKIRRFITAYGLSEYDSDILTESRRMADLLDEAVKYGAAPKKAANWLMVETLYRLKENGEAPENLRFNGRQLSDLILMIEKKQITGSTAKEIFARMYESGIEPVSYAKEHGLWIVLDENLLEQSIEEVLQENPKAVNDFKNGRDKAIAALVGQTMKKMAGQADASLIQQKIREKLK